VRRGRRVGGESSICGVSSEGATPSAAAASTSGAFAYGMARSASFRSSEASSSTARLISTPPAGSSSFLSALGCGGAASLGSGEGEVSWSLMTSRSRMATKSLAPKS